jgi:hypothetical protein
VRQAARRAVCLFTRADRDATSHLGLVLRRRLAQTLARPRWQPDDVRSEMQLVTTSGMYADESTWESRLQLVADVLFGALYGTLESGAPSALARSASSAPPPVTDATLAGYVLVPCLKILTSRCLPNEESLSSDAGKSSSSSRRKKSTGATSSVGESGGAGGAAGRGRPFGSTDAPAGMSDSLLAASMRLVCCCCCCNSRSY